jgi:hypothetical protein
MDMYVRPWDYGRAAGRKLVKPRLPGVVITPGVESPSRGWYQSERGWYSSPTFTGEPRALAQLAGTQTISNSSETVVAVVSTIFLGLYETDPWGMFDATTNGLVIRHPGYYTLGFRALWDSNAVGYRDARINIYRADGTLISNRIMDTRGAVSGTATNQTVSGVALLPTVGDYIQFRVTQTSGGDLDLSSAEMWIYRYAPLTPQLPT